jgi:hypothetical protein
MSVRPPTGRRYATRVFATAGVFNVLVGGAAFLAPDVTNQLLGIARPGNPVFMYLGSWLVLVFGIGYGLTALNPERNRDLMLLGGLGKALVLPLMLWMWHRGEVGASAVAASVSDFVFALLFFDVLRRMPFVPASAE